MKVLIIPWNIHANNSQLLAKQTQSNFVFFDIDVNLNPFYELKVISNIFDLDVYVYENDMLLLQYDFYLFFDVPKRNHKVYRYLNQKKLNYKMGVILWEPVVVNKRNWNMKNHEFFKYIFTWNDNYIDNVKYFKFNFPQINLTKLLMTNNTRKKHLSMISGNKYSFVKNELYSERKKIIDFFEENDTLFDFYGTGWDLNRYLKTKRIFNYKNYGGEVKYKYDLLKEYDFAVCFENQGKINGYITEKIFDCFNSGTIPIYLGCSNISSYIPKECFIDYSDFSGPKELIDFLNSISIENKNEYRENIFKFMNSKDFEIFNFYNFSKNILDVLLAKCL